MVEDNCDGMIYKVTFEDGGIFHIHSKRGETNPHERRPVKGTHYWFLDYLEKDIRDRKWKTIEKCDE